MDSTDKDYRSDFLKSNEPGSRGRIFSGLVVIAVGAVFLARQLGVEFPNWLFSWPMILIVVGLYIGIKHSFRNPAWLIPFGIGSLFLVERFDPALAFKDYIVPVVIIAIGLYIVLRPRKNKSEHGWPGMDASTFARNAGGSDDFIDSVSIFGGSKKNIISKDFRGGDIVTFFGGMELNLTQADIVAPVHLEVTQIFGGTKIVVPSNWKIKSELVTVFGGFDDKRQIVKDATDDTKVLILTGTCLFGGIDVRSY